MHRYLVVAHRTLGGAHLADEVRARLEAGPCSFHLVVPVHHPMGAWSDHDAEAMTTKVLEAGLEQFRSLGAEVTGEMGDANPVYAVDTVLRREPGTFDSIILSTLPVGPSRWLKWDVPNRMARVSGLPVVHVVAERERVH
jgi:hypothetical protein